VCLNSSYAKNSTEATQYLYIKVLRTRWRDDYDPVQHSVLNRGASRFDK